MAKVFVTGGAGFLGSLLVRKLLDDGHCVTSIDLLPDSISHPRLQAHIGDIRGRAALDSLLAAANPEVIFHCAAKLAHDRTKPAEIWSCNVEGTRVLADAAAQHGVAKIVYVSSNCLWGRSFDHPVDEDEPPAPVELYGTSKWEGEKILLARGSDFSTIAIRCPTIVDEGRLGLLAILFEFIADNRRVWTVGGGTNRYQFIYAADLIDAMLLAWRSEHSGVYGIGSDRVGTMSETYRYVIDNSESRSKIGALPRNATILAMRLAHTLRISPLGPYHYRMIASSFVFDTRRIKRDLGWAPSLTNGEMLLRAYRFYHEHRAEVMKRTQVSAHRQATRMGVIRVLKWLS